MSDSGTTTTPPPPTTTPPPTPTAGLSQEDVNRIAAREKEEGKRAGQREMLAALGVSTVEEANEALKRLKDIDDKSKGEVEKAAETATKAQAAADAATRDYRTLAKSTRVRDEVLRAMLGDNAKILDAALMVTRMIEIDDEADDKAVAAAVKAVQDTMPQVFQFQGQPATTRQPPTPRGDGRDRPPATGAAPRVPTRTSDLGSRATELLHERHPRTRPKS
jgi:hypothetical protein